MFGGIFSVGDAFGILGLFGGLASLYAAIRADLLAARMRADEAKDRADEAHGLIVNHITEKH